MDADRLQVGDERAREELEAEGLPSVGGEEVAAMGVHRRPYLVGHR